MSSASSQSSQASIQGSNWTNYPWSRGYNPYGHTGRDVDTPTGTPLTALSNGVILNEGFYPWGGEVDEATVINGQPAYIVLAHLDKINVHKGQAVDTSTVLGLSGGENLPPQYSNGPHTHVGIYTTPDIWQNISPTTGAIETENPDPLLHAYQQNGNPGNGILGLGTNPLDPNAITQGIGAGIAKLFNASSVIDLAWKAGILLIGVILFVLGFQILFTNNVGIPVAKQVVKAV